MARVAGTLFSDPNAFADKVVFSVIDIVGALRAETNYTKNRNYWKYLNAKLKKDGNELGGVTTHLKLRAPDGKKYSTNVLDYDGIIALAKVFPSTKANRFIEWSTYSDETIDGKSKQKASELFETLFIDAIEVGTVKGLRQIHAYLRRTLRFCGSNPHG